MKQYQWRNALKMIDRYRKETYFRFFGSIGYFLCLGLGLSLRKTLREYIKVEEVPLYDGQMMGSSLDQLISLLAGIEVGIVLFLAGLLLFGFFFFVTGLRRQLILQQEELKIKRFLGSSINQVTGEFFWEHLLPVVVGGIVGLAGGLLLLVGIYLVVTRGYRESWPTSWVPYVTINGTIILGASLLFFRQYRKIRKLIVRKIS